MRYVRVSRKEYWIKLAFLAAEFLVVSAILLVVLDAMDAEQPSASGLQQSVAVATIVALFINCIMVDIAALAVILWRARSMGNTFLWFVFGAFVPFGFIALGCIPGREQTSK